MGSSDPCNDTAKTPMAVTMASSTSCNLCGAHDGHVRAGRLGRYSRTCDRCESRRGSHLVRTDRGYANRSVAA